MLSFAPAIPSRNDLDWCWYLRRQGRAGNALERRLHDLGVMDPSGWADWVPSTLTTTGAPVEMAFCATNPNLSLRTEVADPASDPSTRVAQVCTVIADLGGTPPPAALRDVIRAAQGAGNLRFGAWLGLQQNARTLDTSLYAELPAAATDLSGLMWPPDIRTMITSLGPDVRATMLGYDATTGQVKMYFMARNAQRALLPTLAAPAHVSGDVLSMSIDGLADMAPQDALPIPQLGFSYAMHGADYPPQLTVYFSTNALFGTDAYTARRIKACGGKAMPAYTTLIDSLPLAPVGQMHHGMVGLAARPDAAPILSITVAAPWFCLHSVI